MKIIEIIREDRLDEVFPVALAGLISRLPAIAGVTFPTIMASVSAAIAGYGILQLYQLVNQYGDDPESLTDDDWGNLGIDLALVAIPVLGRVGKPVILKLLPDKIKKYFGKQISAQILERFRKESATAKAKYGKAARVGKSAPERAIMVKQYRKAMDKARTTARQKLERFQTGEPIYNVIGKSFGVGVATKFFMDYWGKITQLEEEFKLAKEGNTETSLFGDDPQPEARFNSLKNQYLGELTLVVGTAIAALQVGNLIQLFNGIFGKIVGGGLVGGILKVPGNIVAAIVKLGGPGLAMFLQTESGQTLLKEPIVSAITGVGGALTSGAITAALSGIDNVAKSVGVDATPVTNKLRRPAVTGVPEPQSPQDQNPAVANLAIKVDPRNPNIKYINNHQVTGPDGYVLPTAPIQDIQQTARAFNQPDPFASLKFDPNKQYYQYSTYQDAYR